MKPTVQVTYSVKVKVAENAKVQRRRVLSRVMTRADGQPISVVSCLTSSRQASILNVVGDGLQSRERHGDGSPNDVDTLTGCHEMTPTGGNRIISRHQRPLVRQNCSFGTEVIASPRTGTQFLHYYHHHHHHHVFLLYTAI